jgi:hypothetical protein
VGTGPIGTPAWGAAETTAAEGVRVIVGVGGAGGRLRSESVPL